MLFSLCGHWLLVGVPCAFLGLLLGDLVGVMSPGSSFRLTPTFSFGDLPLESISRIFGGNGTCAVNKYLVPYLLLLKSL